MALCLFLEAALRWLLKQLITSKHLKPINSLTNNRKKNSLDDVVTSDEKFDKVLAEPQKRERCREEKESNKKKRERKIMENKTRKNLVKENTKAKH